MADVWYLDYSAAKLSGTTIRNAGYRGAIRYIAAGRESKQTDLAEYRSHIAAGLDVWLVCQAGTEDADQGYARGAELARAAKAEADGLGYPSNRVIFFTNDRTELPNPAAWRGFLDGATSVLGRSRVGAYGFANAMDAAVGHAVAFWQAGRRSELRSFVNFWQDNNVQVTVGGILCDRNLVVKPMQVESDMELTDPWDDEKINALGPLKLGWSFKNTRDNARAARLAAENAVNASNSAVTAANAAKAEAATAASWAGASVTAAKAALSAATGARQDIADLSAKVDNLPVGGVDVQQLAALVAKAVNDELARRQAE